MREVEKGVVKTILVQMSAPSDLVNVRLPRSVTDRLPALSRRLTERMHELLERNTDGLLSPDERTELETLVDMAQVSEVFSLACQAAEQP